MNVKQVSFYAGVGVVAATHLWLFTASLPDAVKNQHALINLAAAGLIVYGAS
jgi:hypothetical protein